MNIYGLGVQVSPWVPNFNFQTFHEKDSEQSLQWLARYSLDKKKSVVLVLAHGPALESDISKPFAQLYIHTDLPYPQISEQSVTF